MFPLNINLPTKQHFTAIEYKNYLQYIRSLAFFRNSNIKYKLNNKNSTIIIKSEDFDKINIKENMLSRIKTFYSYSER